MTMLFSQTNASSKTLRSVLNTGRSRNPVKNWLGIFQKKQPPVVINTSCGVEVQSGYSALGSGLLIGKLTTFENKDYTVHLTEIHCCGLYLFDTNNHLKLVIRTGTSEFLAIPVLVKSYERHDNVFSVVLSVCQEIAEEGIYERFSAVLGVDQMLH